MSKLVSVVIPNCNRRAETLECVGSLMAQDYGSIEVIVVDNGSTDGSAEAIEKSFPSVKIIRNKTNLGFAEANNQGIEAAKGEYILALNNDALAEKNWVSELVKAAESRGDIGMCASKMIFMQQRGTINSTGIVPFKIGYAYDRGFGEKDVGQYERQEEVFGPCAGAALYKKEALEDIRLNGMYFDSDYFCYFEDADLAWRMQLRGWKCLYVPSAVVYHKHSTTTIEGSGFKTYCMKKNSFLTFLKDSSTETLLLYLPIILAYNMLVFPFYLFRRNGLAIIKATLDSAKELPKTLRKRSEIRSRVKAGRGDVEKWFKNPENPLTSLKRAKFAQEINR